jgi:hypothetical protein
MPVGRIEPGYDCCLRQRRSSSVRRAAGIACQRGGPQSSVIGTENRKPKTASDARPAVSKSKGSLSATVTIVAAENATSAAHFCILTGPIRPDGRREPRIPLKCPSPAEGAGHDPLGFLTPVLAAPVDFERGCLFLWGSRILGGRACAPHEPRSGKHGRLTNGRRWLKYRTLCRC